MTPSSILKGTAILLFLQGVSTVALNLCGIKFPPALLAMILLLVLLLSGVILIFKYYIFSWRIAGIIV